jgi:hypothetical protein
MSDPVTNAEVEDVLSSIRRLVSEDKRPLHVAQNDKPNDRLVLTPALRVAEAHEVVDVSGEANPEDDLPPDVENEDVSTFVLTEDHSAPTSETSENVEDHAHDYDADPYNFDDNADADGEADAASFLEKQHEGTHELPGYLETDTEKEWSVSEESADHADDYHDVEETVSTDTSSVADLENADLADDSQTIPSKADVLRDKITELEAAIGSIAGKWDVDTGATEMAAPNTEDVMAWEDASPEDAISSQLHVYDPDMEDNQSIDKNGLIAADEPAEHSPEIDTNAPEGDAVSENVASQETAQPAEAMPDYTEEPQLLDEEALRDMVSEIVRAELQGALGERITRNVRKLVRREIHQALTAQDLE